MAKLTNAQFEQWVLSTIAATGSIEISAADRRNHIRILDKLRHAGKIRLARTGTEFTRYEVDSPPVRNPDYKPDQHKRDLKNRW